MKQNDESEEKTKIVKVLESCGYSVRKSQKRKKVMIYYAYGVKYDSKCYNLLKINRIICIFRGFFIHLQATITEKILN